MKGVLLLLPCLFALSLGYVDYSGYQVLRYTPLTQEHVELLHMIEAELNIDFWVEPSVPGRPVDIMVSPDEHDLMVVMGQDMPHEGFIEDVGELIKAVSVNHHPVPSKRDYDTSRFYTLTEMQDYVQEEATACGADCELVNIGTSFEGRPINIIKITRPGTDRRAVWLDGGIHAREWLAPTVPAYIIDRLINDYGTDPEITALRDSFDWYIHPIVNPDGYEYSWSTDRMWRKTRQPNSQCVGTDGNRNYAHFSWDLGSTDGCSQIYRGATPDSESEIAAITNYLGPIGSDFDMSINYHTYEQAMFRNWAYTTDNPADYLELDRLGNIGVDAINANSDVSYFYDKTSGTHSGMSIDWAKVNGGMEYSYLVELRDTGSYGFIAPPEEILPTCIEAFAGVIAMALDLAGRK